MTVKQWLSRAAMAQRQVEFLKQAIDKAKNGQSSSDGAGKDYSNENKAENRLVYAIYLEKKLEEAKENLAYVQKEIFCAVASVEDNRLRTVLEERYILDKPIKVIAMEQGYNDRWVYSLLKQGEEKIEQAVFPGQKNR